MITLLVITDGRDDALEQTIASAEANLVGPITERVIYDDTGDFDHHRYLVDHYGTFDVVQHPAGRQGFGGAIRCAWDYVQKKTATPYIFHLEDDFVFNRPVPLVPMAHALDTHPHIVNMALRRQAWNDAEREAGGPIEQWPDDFTEVSWTPSLRLANPQANTYTWLEHRRWFTTNPSLYRRSLTAQHWPRGAHSEGRFTHQLLASPKVRFGYWGGWATGRNLVTHIGEARVGVGY